MEPLSLEVDRPVEAPPADPEFAGSEQVNWRQASCARIRLRCYVALFLLDAFALVFGFLCANLLRFGDLTHVAGLELLATLAPVYAAVSFSNRSYSIEVLKLPNLSVKRSVTALIIAVSASAVAVFYLKAGHEFSRLAFGIGTVVSLFLLVSARLAFGFFVGSRLMWRFTNDVLLVDGVRAKCSRGTAVLDARAEGLVPSLNDPDLLNRMGKILRNADRVVIACRPERRASWASALRGLGLPLEIQAPELDRMGAVGFGRFEQTSTAVVALGPMGIRDQIVKRAFDLFISVPAVIVLLPVFAAIAIAIKIDSRGPIFFRQPRIGKGNRTFMMLKFRTMKTEACDVNASSLTRRFDQRVTKVGNFLRRTSMDEIPQLLNVLQGSMSIVGPRPHARGALAGGVLYWEVDSRYWIRHSVKPGITGLAQIRGHRGTTFQKADLQQRLRSDLEYLSDWSIWRDVVILISTLKVIVHQKAF